MTKQAARSQGLAALCLLVVLIGGATAAGGEVASLWALAMLGAAACLAGIAGLCVFVYQVHRQTGCGVLKALGRTAVMAIAVVFSLPP